MKSLKELQNLLIDELCSRLDAINNIPKGLEYYNDALGYAAPILAGILESLLKGNIDGWDHNKWIDDGLLEKVDLNNKIISIWGVMISGTEDVAGEQWVEPFYFKAKMCCEDLYFIEYVFLFGDLERPEIPYGYFRNNRGYWNREYYTNDTWDPSERNWKYRFYAGDKSE